MYCTESSLNFSFLPLKKNSYGKREFTFKNKTYKITYHSNFSYKHFSLIDCIVHNLRSIVFNQYKKNENDKDIPYRPKDERISDNVKMYGPFIDKNFIKHLYINDNMIRNHPTFRLWDGWKIFNFINETSNIIFEDFNYQYISYDKVDNRYSYTPFQIMNKCKLFDVELVKKQHGNNFYKIEFNSLFGKMFAYNVNVFNMFLVPSNFYDLDGLSQNLYRFFKHDKEFSVGFDELVDLFEYGNTKYNKNNIIKSMSKRFDKMKSMYIITNWSFSYDTFRIW